MRYEKYLTETTEGMDVSANNVSANCITSKNNKFGIDTEGNITCNSITTNNSKDDLLYPVGSIYMNVSNVNPATLFGGKWEQIKDCFLLASGTTYALGKTGGSPIHSHSQGASGAATGNTGSTTLTVEQMPNHTHALKKKADSYEFAMHNGTITNSIYTGGPGSFYANLSGDYVEIGTNGGDKGHTHTLGNHTHSNPNTNSSSNIPPYIAINVWKRIG